MNYNIRNIIKKGMWGLVALTAFTACTETWDEHYGASESQSLGKGTMWEAIENNPELSNFKTLLEATDFSENLKGGQVFTIFAPTNDMMSESEVANLVEQYKAEKQSLGSKSYKYNTVLNEYLRNMVARYTYSVTSTDTTVTMLNGKKLLLTPVSIDGKLLEGKPVQTGNGLLYTLSEPLTYKPNLYEVLAKDADLSELKEFVYSKSYDEFQPGKSVPGDVKDGKQHYLDSVTVLRNELFNRYNPASNSASKNVGIGDFNDEDSTFYMVVPNNKLWAEMLERYQQYFQYDNSLAMKEIRDSFMTNFPRYEILKGTLFSTANVLNEQLKQHYEDGTSKVDSVWSTNAVAFNMRKALFKSYDKIYYQYANPFAEGGIFADAEEVECSNGILYKANKWNIPDSVRFVREIVMEGESALDSIFKQDTRTPNYPGVLNSNKFFNKISNNSYIELKPSGSAYPKALFKITDVLSNVAYDMFVVFAPAEAGDSLATEDVCRATKFRAAVQCNDINGKPIYIKPDAYYKPGADKRIADVPAQDPNKIIAVPTAALFGNPQGGSSDFESVPHIVNRCFIGTFTFPTCSYNTPEAQVKVYLQNRVSNTNVTAGTHTKQMNIDCIILKPCIGDGCPNHN